MLGGLEEEHEWDSVGSAGEWTRQLACHRGVQTRGGKWEACQCVCPLVSFVLGSLHPRAEVAAPETAVDALGSTELTQTSAPP